MAVAKDYADINPRVLRWARLRAGYDVPAAAKKIGVKPDRIEAWEKGEAPVTLGRLDDLADLYKRPTIIFYMDAPPREKERTGADFREQQASGLTPEIIYQLRRAHERREVALDLCRELGLTPAKFTFKCAQDEDPEAVGTRLRAFLGPSINQQKSWCTRDGYRALNAWKDAAEAVGVLVTQASRKSLSGCRGLSVHGDIPVIVLSTETVRGRIFTLFHELAHLGLREGGVCDLHDAGIERFCNEVAAAALLPRDALLADADVGGERGRTWRDATLRQLAERYSVSEPAFVLRLVTLRLAVRALYDSKAAEYRRRIEQAKATQDGDDSETNIPQHTLALAANGRGFTRLVLEAYHRGALTGHRAATYLGTSLRFVPEIERDLIRHHLAKAGT